MNVDDIVARPQLPGFTGFYPGITVIQTWHDFNSPIISMRCLFFFWKIIYNWGRPKFPYQYSCFLLGKSWITGLSLATWHHVDTKGGSHPEMIIRRPGRRMSSSPRRVTSASETLVFAGRGQSPGIGDHPWRICTSDVYPMTGMRSWYAIQKNGGF